MNKSNSSIKKAQALKKFKKMFAPNIVDGERWYRPIFVDFKINYCAIKETYPRNSENFISLEELSKDWDIKIVEFDTKETPSEYFIRKITKEGNYEYLSDTRSIGYIANNKQECEEAIELIKNLAITGKTKKIRKRAEELYKELQ